MTLAAKHTCSGFRLSDLSLRMGVFMFSHAVASDSATPWTVAHQVPLSMEFSRQEYWSGVPFHPSGDLPEPGIKPVSPASPALAGGSLQIRPGKKKNPAKRAQHCPHQMPTSHRLKAVYSQVNRTTGVRTGLTPRKAGKLLIQLTWGLTPGSHLPFP